MTKTLTGKLLAKTGVVEQMTDKDWFSFTSPKGKVSLTVNVAPVGPNLDVKLELWTLKPVTLPGGFTIVLPQKIAEADPSSSLSATITANVDGGKYYLAVRSHGVYGDLGRYTVTGKVPGIKIVLPPILINPVFVEPPPPPPPPFTAQILRVGGDTAAASPMQDSVHPVDQVMSQGPGAEADEDLTPAMLADLAAGLASSDRTWADLA